MTDVLVPVVETPAVDAAAVAEATSGVATSGSAGLALPRVIVEAGPVATGKFVEFFAGRIANERTRAAYARAAGQFLGWCEGRGLRLEAVEPLHVAAYIRTHPGVGADREAAPGRDPHALRLARRQPGPPGEPHRGRPGGIFLSRNTGYHVQRIDRPFSLGRRALGGGCMESAT